MVAGGGIGLGKLIQKLCILVSMVQAGILGCI